MRTLKQRYTVAIALFGLVTPLTLYLNYNVPPAVDIGNIAKAIPTTLDKWVAEGEDRGGSEDEKIILQTDAILTRTYRAGRHMKCELSLVHAQDNPNAVHPPELCYTGGGWTETVRDTITLPIEGKTYRLNRRKFVRGGGVNLWVIYWFKAGQECHHSYLRFQLAALKARLLRSGCSCNLVQVRAEYTDPEMEQEVFVELGKFAISALPAVNAAIP